MSRRQADRRVAPVLMGPVLALTESRPDELRLTAVVVARTSPGGLVAGAPAGEACPPEALWSVGGRTAFRYRIVAPLRDAAYRLPYEVGGRRFEIAVPARGQSPNMAYASCNGFSSAKVMRQVRDKNAMWRRMAERHGQTPYHLLLLGGDQVYADSMWETVPGLQQWARKPYAAANRAKAPPALVAAVKAFFFDLYVDRWSQPEVAAMMASVPSIAMWDDHDLMDGWGSYPPERQGCEVFQKAIWPAASKAFLTFQQHLADGETHPAWLSPGSGLSRGHVVGGTAIAALDMRSERTPDRVMSPPHWAGVFDWMLDLDDVRHLVVMSSIPVVYPGFDTLERLLGVLPGHQDLEDDLRDHWNSRPHKGERLRMVHRLMQIAQQKLIRPTIVSGDVHVAALGVIESARGERGGGAVIDQLISSGIVHPGPGGAVLFALRHLFDNADEMDQGLRARMVEFPGTQERFVGRRNYLSLEPDTRGDLARIWANWFVEGETAAYTKVVHPLERSRQAEQPASAAAVSAG